MSSETLKSACEAMAKGALFDVTIICTTDDHQASYWMKRLSEGICAAGSDGSDSKFPLVLAVSEDWGAGGAGNGLGTLYAYTKAVKLAKEAHGIDLEELLAKGEVSAALFHTAGKGTRMAPLPASENNNKPGVRLPVCHNVNDQFIPITVLEAVVKQTGVYAKSRKGRLSVFWGDQVFVPSAAYEYTPTHHIDIMCTLLGETAPTAEEWSAQGLDKYGVIAVLQGEAKNAAQVEKVSHATAVKMLESLGDIGQVGPSLGSFSVSSAFLSALCKEYSTELEEKTAKLDTDPHFWMPLTLPAEEYKNLMEQKGIDKEVSHKHHERMTAFKATLDLTSMGLFGAVDVGKDACWWDYGQLKLYSTNNLALLESNAQSDLLRSFMGITSNVMQCDLASDVTVDDTSRVFGCKVSGSGSIAESAMANVTAKDIDVTGAIVVNCVAPKITAGKGAILYNLVSEEPIVAEAGDVKVEVTAADGSSFLLQSALSIDGGKNWKIKLDMNEMTFEEVMKKNFNADITTVETKRKENYDKVAAGL